MGHIPVIAAFVLFDFVVHNPKHPETKKNMAYMDIAAGFFTRVDLASHGFIQGTLFAELVQIARQHLLFVEACDQMARSSHPPPDNQLTYSSTLSNDVPTPDNSEESRYPGGESDFLRRSMPHPEPQDDCTSSALAAQHGNATNPSELSYTVSLVLIRWRLVCRNLTNFLLG